MLLSYGTRYIKFIVCNYKGFKTKMFATGNEGAAVSQPLLMHLIMAG
jgi:hypothetical protein